MGISESSSRAAADSTGQVVPPESDRPWSIETNGIEPIAESERHGKPVYSGGLNRLVLGLKTERYKPVAIDAVVMIIGNIYVLFIAESFFAPFEGFLVTLGVLLAAWAGIFLADLALLRWRDGYDERSLYTGGSRQPVNWSGFIALIVAGVIGLSLVTSASAVFSWSGYLLGLVGGKHGAVGGSSIGVLIALVIGALVYLILALATGQRPRRTAAAVPAGAYR
jgi:NCS1 family nucleobase:cation symporter-1